MVGSEYYGRTTRGTFVDTRTNFKPKLPPLWWIRVTGPAVSASAERNKTSGMALESSTKSKLQSK